MPRCIFRTQSHKEGRTGEPETGARGAINARRNMFGTLVTKIFREVVSTMARIRTGVFSCTWRSSENPSVRNKERLRSHSFDVTSLLAVPRSSTKRLSQSRIHVFIPRCLLFSPPEKPAHKLIFYVIS